LARRLEVWVDLASLVTGCVYFVLCDFCQFVINICDTSALLSDLLQHNISRLFMFNCLFYCSNFNQT